MEWFQIGSGYYGVAPHEIDATEPASQIVDAAFASAFELSPDEARTLFGSTPRAGRTALQTKQYTYDP